MSPSRETSWTLPLCICLELDADQQDFIRDLIHDFEQRTKRTARAKATTTTTHSERITAAGIKFLPRETTSGDAGYIKPSPSPSAVKSATATVSPSDRPVSIYPPELSEGASTTRSSAAARRSDRVEYMCMNGAAAAAKH